MVTRGLVNPRPSGFSLIEAAMAVVFAGVLITGAATLLGSFAKARTVQTAQAKMRAAAGLMLSEILRCRYVEPVDTPTWGTEQGENGVSRLNYDDLDDYSGLPGGDECRDREGKQIEGYKNYTQTVEVVYVDPTNIDVISPTDTKLIRVTVTVTDNYGKSLTLKALRSSASVSDYVPAWATTYVTWADVSLRLGNEERATRRGANLLNRVVAN